MATVTVISEPFRALAENERRSLGMPDLPIVLIGHPLVDNPRQVVETKADGVLAALLESLMASPSAPGATP